jgi:hypothetical protein
MTLLVVTFSCTTFRSLPIFFLTGMKNRKKKEFVLVNKLPPTPFSFCVSFLSLLAVQYPHNYIAVGHTVRV